MFFYVGLGKDFLTTLLKAQVTKAKIGKWDFTKLKYFCTIKERIYKVKRQPMDWEKIFANYLSDKGLLSKIHKEPKTLNSKKTNNS
jgi:hypothetical protein